MRPGPRKGERDQFTAMRSWPLWELPGWLVAYIAVVVAVAAAAMGLAVWVGPGTGRDLVLFGVLLACNAATVELTKRAGENTGVVKDVHGVWELPIAILLPPVYALVAPVLRLALVQWRIKHVPLSRRVFSGAVIGLSYAAASVTFHAVTQTPLEATVPPGAHASAWVFAVAVAGVVQWAVNTALLLPAVKGSDPAVSLRTMIIGRETLQYDVGELCVAALVTLAVATSPFTIVLAFPFVTLLQRSVRHAQLVNASRIDSKTGLLNAGTWEREAAAEVARAARTHTPLALALIDIDHFKSVNDTYGHLTGDTALKAIARTFQAFVREYDLVGRFGGEEFAILLPHTRAADARRIAERMRVHISGTPVDVGGEPSVTPVRMTVSIGVAAVDGAGGGGGRLTDLLAAADSALYRAKQAGRDQVWMVTDTETVGPPVDLSQRAPVSGPRPVLSVAARVMRGRRRGTAAVRTQERA